jgi:hypothetical protein
MVGEARLTAHGSAGPALAPGGAASPEGALGPAGAVIEAVAVVVVACGVFATVESPEPQPVSDMATSTAAARPVSGWVRNGSDHTSPNRTVIGPAGGTGVPRAAPAAPSFAALAITTKLDGR